MKPNFKPAAITTDSYEVVRTAIVALAEQYTVGEDFWHEFTCDALNMQEIGCGYYGNCVPYEADAVQDQDGNIRYLIVLNASFRMHPDAMFAYERADEFYTASPTILKVFLTREEYRVFTAAITEIELGIIV